MRGINFEMERSEIVGSSAAIEGATREIIAFGLGHWPRDRSSRLHRG
jgi:hypothetical protein